MPRLRGHRNTWLAWSMAGVAVALTCLAALLAYLNGHPLIQTERPWVPELVLAGLLSLSYSLLGALMASRRPRNPIGWIFCAIGLILCFGWFATGYAEYALLTARGSVPVGKLMLTFRLDATFPVISALLALMFLLFPNGRLPSRRWWPIAVLDASALLVAFASLFRPGALIDGYEWVDNPLGVRWLQPLTDIFKQQFVGQYNGQFVGLFVGGIALVFLSIASLADRYRLSGREERQQIKWLAFSAGLLAFDVAWWLWALTTTEDLPSYVLDVGISVPMFVLFVAVPAAVTMAILRYRLYDIDLLISRTLVYGLLTAALALGYSAGVTLVQLLLDPLTDTVAGEQSQMAVVGTTLAIAALARPLRNRIQRVIDRRFYRRRYDAAQTVEAFAAMLRDEVDLDTICGDLLGVVHETVQPTHASLWLRPLER